MLELDCDVSESSLVDNAVEIVLRVRPEWSRDSVLHKVFTDGITNKLVGFWAKDDMGRRDTLLVRVYGQQTEEMIDREAEKQNMQLMASLGCAKPLHAVFNNGICYGFVHGQCLNTETVRDPVVGDLIAQELVKIHAVKPSAPTDAAIWKILRKFADLMPDRLADPVKATRLEQHLPSPDQIRAQVSEVESIIRRSTTSPIVFCHNDLLLGNVVWNKEEGRTYFIDYEYGAFNYLAFDIANHFNEHTGTEAVFDQSLFPDREYQLRWLTNYIRHSKALEQGSPASEVEVSEEEVGELFKDVQRHTILSDLMWGIWAVRQANVSTIDFDFVGYAISKFGGFWEKKSKFLHS